MQYKRQTELISDSFSLRNSEISGLQIIVSQISMRVSSGDSVPSVVAWCHRTAVSAVPA